MHPDCEKTLVALRDGVAGMTAAQMSGRPAGKWSAGEIVDHLLKTFASTAYILERCLEQGAPKGRAVRPVERLKAFIVLDVGYFPTGIKAPAIAEPSSSPSSTVLQDGLDALARFDRAAAQAESRFGTRARLANHPVLGPFSARQWRRFHLVHTRHHMKQLARRLRER